MRLLLLLIPCVMASNRVVVTFETKELAMGPHVINATVVKQYGRRLVLDLKRPYVAEVDDGWIQEKLNQTVIIEEDILIKISNIDLKSMFLEGADMKYSMDFDQLDDSLPTTNNLNEMINMDWPETTPLPMVAEEESVPWNLADSEPYSMKVEGMWKVTNSTPDVVVAVIDSGMARSARSAFLNLARGYDFISDDYIAGDGDLRDSDATDPGPTSPDCSVPSWHGTKVSSVLAAKHETGVYGVAQNCTVLPIRVLGLCSQGYANDITDGIVWAVGGAINGVETNPKPARIISMSLAGTGSCPSYLQSAINQAHTAGAIIVVAAGNDGKPNIDDTFPANCDNVISVGSVGRDGTISTFSNKGATTNAPGENIPSLNYDQSIVLSTGTSIATPQIAGLKALTYFKPTTSNLVPMPSTQNTSVVIKGAGDCSGAVCGIVDGNCDYRGFVTEDCTWYWCPGGSVVVDPFAHEWRSIIYDNIYMKYKGYHNGYPYYTGGGQAVTCYSGQYYRFWCEDFPGCSSYNTKALGACSSHMSVLPNAACYRCEAGKAAAAYETSCSTCPAGKYAPLGSASCLSCPDGKYSASAGSGSCIDCSPGWGSYGPSNPTSCFECVAGSYSAGGEPGCQNCPTCTNQPWKEYMSGCNSNGLTSFSGTCTQCICPLNTYYSSGCSLWIPPVCNSCPDNTNGPGGAVDSLYKKPLITTCSANAGYYGAAGVASSICNIGYYCPKGSTSQRQCDVNHYCSDPGLSAPRPCPANTQSQLQSTSINACIAKAGYYGPAGQAATACPGGAYCPAGATTATACPLNNYCPALSGTYTPCPSNTNSPQQSSSVYACVANAGYFGSAGSAASLCTAGFYCSGGDSQVQCTQNKYCIAGSSAQQSCPDNTNSPAQSTSLTWCVSNPGYYGVGSATLCEKGYACPGGLMRIMCDPGFFSLEGQSACSTCSTERYTSDYASSACLPCASACTIDQFIQVTCTKSTNRVCCDSASQGFFKTGCATEASCPAILYGNYTLNGQSSLNRCADFRCMDGYFAMPSKVQLSKTSCVPTTPVGLLMYGLHYSCANVMPTICQLYKVCTNATTKLVDLNYAMIPDPVTTDVQCTNCITCGHGLTELQSCTGLSQTVCAKCPWDGLINTYGHQGNCIVDIPIGYYPYQLVLTAAYQNLFTSNAENYLPKSQVTSTGTLQPITSGVALTLNTFLPCKPPATGYKFVEWSSFPATKSLVINSKADYQYVLSYTEFCDSTKSMDCIEYSASTKSGWFRNATQHCQPCTKTSTYTTCGWGEFRDLNTCNKLQDSLCQACRGSLPTNAVWTFAKSPYFFDSSEPAPCNWDCNMGFYKNAATQTCQACTNKPANANFDYGPFQYNTVINKTICRTPADCKFFGGTQANGCMWVCVVGYRFTVLGPNSYACVACPPVSCLPGQQLIPQADRCYSCQTCTPIVENAVYGENCAFTCRNGYFTSNVSYCSPCSVASCPANYYSGGCVGSYDSSCQPCSLCPKNTRVAVPCGLSSNTVCLPCTEPLIDNSEYNEQCEIVCQAGYIMVNGTCLKCMTKNADCPAGMRVNTTCTADNMGCSACQPPNTYNWCWVNGLQACSWDCTQNYRKLGLRCVYDPTKTNNVICLTRPSLLITTPPPGTTPVNLTNYTNYTETPSPFTTPEPAPILRQTIEMDNLTVQECTCYAARVSRELSKLYMTRVYVASCEQNGVKVLCENFMCPCSQSRRLLADLQTTTLYVVYEKRAETNNTETNLALQIAYDKEIIIKSSYVDVIPINYVRWDPDAIFFQPTDDNNNNEVAARAVTVIIVALLVFLIIALVQYNCWSESGDVHSTKVLNLRIQRNS